MNKPLRRPLAAHPRAVANRVLFGLCVGFARKTGRVRHAGGTFFQETRLIDASGSHDENHMVSISFVMFFKAWMKSMLQQAAA